MIFKKLLLYAILAFVSVISKKNDYKYSYKNLNYNFYCLKDNRGACKFLENELHKALDSIIKITDILTPTYFEVFVDDISKLRLDTTREDVAIVLNNDFTPIGLNVNVKSPYPNADLISKNMSVNNKNEFIVVLNSFKSNKKYLDKTHKDFYSSIIMEVFEELKTLKKVGFPYVKESRYDEREIYYNVFLPKREHVDAIYETAQLNTNDCNDLINFDKVNTVIHWEDTLISKDKTIGRSISKNIKNHLPIVQKNKYDRVVVVPDIHGDYEHLISILRHSKVIDKKNNWIGKDTILIQTGDLLNRGNDTMKIYDTMMDLREQAQKKGGIIYMLIGNHEIFEVRGNHYFTSKVDLDIFGGMEAHEKAFGPEGKYGKFIRNVMNTTMIIDDTIYTHAGIRPDYLGSGIDELNTYIRDLLVSTPSVQELYDLYMQNITHPVLTDRVFDDWGPFWLRDFAKSPESQICNQVEETLRLTNTKRMVIGHTPQTYGKMKTRCNNKLIIIDVGVSRCIGGGYYGYLEILNKKQEIWARYLN